MTAGQNPQGFLIIPHLRIQNANAVSSPLTHGFPAITAFLGLMWALDRKLAEADIALVPEKVGMICHDYEEQVQEGYVKTFRLTRNPVDKDGSTAAIVEEGRIHLDVTLVFQVNGGDAEENNVIFHEDKSRHREIAWRVRNLLETMRVAGGTILPATFQPGKRITPTLTAWPDDFEAQAMMFRRLRRSWLPGFALVSRDDLLQQHFQKLRELDANITLLDAWLDLSRFNYRSKRDDAGDRIVWTHDRPKGAGWIVPMPVGYAGLSDLYDGGEVLNARDDHTPLRFVESVYSMGEWVSPHRLGSMQDLLWEAETRADQGLYLCRNRYTAPAMEKEREGIDSVPSNFASI